MAGMGIDPPVNETVVDAVDILEQVGLEIGHVGEQIQLIRQQSGCKLQMAGKSCKKEYCQCTLRRSRQCTNHVDENMTTADVNSVKEKIKGLKRPLRIANGPTSTGEECKIVKRLGSTNKLKSKLEDMSMPKTPDHYWDIDYPSLKEQLERGYLIHTKSPLFKKQCNRPKRRLFRE